MKIGAIVLAAGGSTRLGTPKQLLEYQGKTFLRRAVETALEARCQPVLVVLQPETDQLEDELNSLKFYPVINAAWENGLGTSVRLGTMALEALAPGVDGALLTLCDQPLVDAAALGRLLDAFRPEKIAAAAYDGTVGVPAVFGRAFFDELCALPDDAGAKALLMEHRSSVVEVPLPEAALDIDTRAQYERLIDNSNRW